MTPPHRYWAWPSIAQAADQLLADRRNSDPKNVTEGKLTAAKAADRERIMSAVVAIWRAVLAREPAPAIEACHAEIRADLADVRAKLSTLAAANPASNILAERLELVVALEWYQQPCLPGHDLPWILQVHEANLIGRARADAARAARPVQPTNPGGQYVSRSAARAPIATGGASVAASTKHQPGLF